MHKAIYTTVGIDELLPHVQALKGVGARFVQMHAERCVDDGSYRLVYTFINVRAAQEQIARDGNYAIENLVVEGIDQYQEIPSISSYYPAVFPFENEAYDLFGLAITDMQVDFKGFFYQVSTAEPMSVITPEVKAAREKAMKVRAAAEAKAHGKPPETAMFHEVGAIDSIVDVCSVAICLDDLGVEDIVVESLSEGHGTIHCAHGLMPIPVPAVVNLCQAGNIALTPAPVAGELVTPTGAAIVAALRTSEHLPARYRIEAVGYGAGKRPYEGCSGTLRCLLVHVDA